MVLAFRVNKDRVKVEPVTKFVINRIGKDRFVAQMLEPLCRNAQVYGNDKIMNKDYYNRYTTDKQCKLNINIFIFMCFTQVRNVRTYMLSALVINSFVNLINTQNQ